MDPDRQTLSLMKRLCLSLLFLSTIAWSCGNPQRSANSKDSTANGHTAGGSDAGMLLVANKADATLYFINTETLELIDSTTTGEDPHEAVVTPDGAWAYTANMSGNSLSVIDMGKLEEVRRIDLSEYGKPHGLDVSDDGEFLYVTTEGSRRAVLEIEVATDNITRVFETGQNGTHMVVLGGDGNTAYAANLGNASTTVIDLGAGKVVKTLATGDGTEGIDVSPDGKEIWVSARSGSRSEEHTSELQSLMRTSYAVFCLKKKKKKNTK